MIRGQAPAEFHQTLERGLETIHREESAALTAFAGNSAPFESLRPILEGCLQSQSKGVSRPGMSPMAWLVLALVLLALLAWAGLGWRQRAKREALLGQLRAEPGLVITAAESAAGKLIISGLRDPLAADPGQIADKAGWPSNQVEFRLQPFLALSPKLTLQRAASRLAPPASVELALREGVLVFSGSAPEAWWREARAQSLLVPGIESLSAEGLRVISPAREPSLAERLASIRQDCERTVVLFERGKSSAPEAGSGLAAAAALARELRDLARSSGAKAALLITGHSDPSGTEPLNLKLRSQRAEWVRQKLLAAGLPEDSLQIDGTSAPRSEPASVANPRRVTFSVLWQHEP